MVITSKDNEIIKHIKKLKEKKYRDEYNEFVIEGIKLLEEAISENVNIKQIIICDDCKSQGAIEKDLLYEIAKYNCVYVAEKIFDMVTNVVTHQGIMAIIEKPNLKENVNVIILNLMKMIYDNCKVFRFILISSIFSFVVSFV